MTREQTELLVGTRVRILPPNSVAEGEHGTVIQGPKRLERGFVFPYLVKLDKPAPNGVDMVVGFSHEFLPLEPTP